MPKLTSKPTLADFQHYVAELEVERNFANQPVIEKCLLLGEEVGELFQAIRKAEGIAIDPNAKVGEIGDELSDIFIYLCSIANRYDIDLESAFLAKEEKNKQRTWQPANTKKTSPS
ncbi:MazG nucleotide pyrophosphohydrolase domain-containing protein [Vibrio renipiscarius]|uniref:MazG nucleotide pyrophosphohydrolase n=1 Tax=Vibrio renipiscarius TaxID=1461322 RepID=A0A0C2NQP0_9VIBR|nr:MazG nucleotide pyrophosphohydrolase domain-containing protein [Vibrio renipiscarius]KII76487.1 MazG nucleotide pyrophosphohydrolase [Vibrio renipiscarius]KII77991.1 MazG nucleotide pyrophosphohydrolase [Vibrio renipiscarius]